MLLLFELVPLAIVVLSTLVGFAFGGRAKVRPGADEGPSSVVQAAVLGTVGLLIGFTFAFDATRYDARRHLVVQEANAIETTYLRASFLSSPLSAKARDLLKRYVDARIAVRLAPELRDSAATDQSALLQRQLWAVATEAARTDRRPQIVALFIQSLNEAIDVTSAEADSLKDRAPPAIVILLLLALVVSGLVIGFGLGRAHERAWAYPLAFALISSFAVYTIFDLDNPESGFIRSTDEPLLVLQQRLPTWTQAVPLIDQTR